jgi:hypothetical protein
MMPLAVGYRFNLFLSFIVRNEPSIRIAIFSGIMEKPHITRGLRLFGSRCNMERIYTFLLALLNSLEVSNCQTYSCQYLYIFFVIQ